MQNILLEKIRLQVQIFNKFGENSTDLPYTNCFTLHNGNVEVFRGKKFSHTTTSAYSSRSSARYRPKITLQTHFWQQGNNWHCRCAMVYNQLNSESWCTHEQTRIIRSLRTIQNQNSNPHCTSLSCSNGIYKFPYKSTMVQHLSRNDGKVHMLWENTIRRLLVGMAHL